MRRSPAPRRTQGGALPDEVIPWRSLTRTLGLQYVVGGVLTLLWLATPGAGPSTGRSTVVGLALLALGLGAAMRAAELVDLDARGRARTAHGCILSAQVVVCFAYAATREPSSPLLLFLLWTTPYAGIFSVRARSVHCLSTGLLLGGASLAMPAALRTEAAVLYLAVMSTVVVTTLLVSRVTARLRDAAMHDALTGLPNRRSFHASTRDALLRRATHGGTVVVALLDLDRFKHVNDTHGHEAGDALLQALAPRLVEALTPVGTVARLGGDEFAVLCEDPLGVLVPADVAARIEAALRAPEQVAGRDLPWSGCTGFAVADDGASAQTLLRDADAAMYHAKAVGPGSYRVFDDELAGRRGRELAVEQGLRDAVRRGTLELHYQPVVALSGPCDGRTLGVEALLRWTSPELGPVTPDEFIPVAEATGLIGELGTWVLHRAVADLAAWRRAGLVDTTFRVAVNVSPHQVGDALVTEVAGLLDRYGLPARCLGIEITESAVMTSAEAGPVLDELHRIGVVLLLDDFGSGYSSLSHLRQYPFDVVKVDRAFVTGLCERPRDAAVLRAVLALASALGMTVVAEGIETPDQHRALQEAGCQAGQGWLFSRALPAERLVELLRQSRPSYVRTG